MSNIKTYRITASEFDWAEVILEVNHDVLTPGLATEINTFWSGGEWRLDMADGDPAQAVIQLFGSCAIAHFLSDGGADIVASDQASRERWTKQVIDAQHEGWPDVAGLGILINRVCVNTVGFDDVEMEQMV